MLGKRFKKGFVSALKLKKWKKSFSKVSYTGKKYYFINILNSQVFLKNLNFLKFKTRRYYLRNLNKKNLYKNFKSIVLKNSKTMLLNPYKFLFKTYSILSVISINYGKLSDFHLEMIRKSIKNFLSKKSLIFLRIKPYMIMLKRSAQIRMGGGKASKISMVYYPVVPGSIIFDIYGITYKAGFNVVNSLKSKLPISIKFFFKNLF